MQLQHLSAPRMSSMPLIRFSSAERPLFPQGVLPAWKDDRLLLQVADQLKQFQTGFEQKRQALSDAYAAKKWLSPGGIKKLMLAIQLANMEQPIGISFASLKHDLESKKELLEVLRRLKGRMLVEIICVADDIRANDPPEPIGVRLTPSGLAYADSLKQG